MQPKQGRNINDIIKASNKNKASMTACHKGGVKIRDTGNGNIENPFANVNPFSSDCSTENDY